CGRHAGHRPWYRRRHPLREADSGISIVMAAATALCSIDDRCAPDPNGMIRKCNGERSCHVSELSPQCQIALLDGCAEQWVFSGLHSVVDLGPVLCTQALACE